MTKVKDGKLAQWLRFQHDISERILKGSLNPDEAMDALRPLVGQNGTSENKIVAEKSYLKLISGGNNPTVPACTEGGKNSLHYAKETFTGFIDSDFKNWNLVNPQSATEPTVCEVYELCEDGKLAEIFGSFNVDLKNLALKQNQIESFCKNFPNWLHPEGYSTLFLFEENGQFFVALAYWRKRLVWEVGVHQLSDPDVWNVWSNTRFCSYYRVVVPATWCLVS